MDLTQVAQYTSRNELNALYSSCNATELKFQFKSVKFISVALYTRPCGFGCPGKRVSFNTYTYPLQLTETICR